MTPFKYKVVLDTNIIVSAALTAGKSSEVLALWKKGLFDIIVCQEIIEEYFTVLSRDKFCLPISLITTILEEFNRKGKWINKSSSFNIIKNDPSDNKFLEAAFDAEADFIISGDQHLLALGKFNDIPIIQPNKFIGLLKV